MCWDDTIVDLQHEEFAFDLGLNKISAGWTKGQATKQKKQAQNQETTGLQIQNLSQILFKLKIKCTVLLPIPTSYTQMYSNTSSKWTTFSN